LVFIFGKLKHKISWKSGSIPPHGSLELFCFCAIQLRQVSIQNDLLSLDETYPTNNTVNRNQFYRHAYSPSCDVAGTFPLAALIAAKIASKATGDKWLKKKLQQIRLRWWEPLGAGGNDAAAGAGVVA